MSRILFTKHRFSDTALNTTANLVDRSSGRYMLCLKKIPGSLFINCKPEILAYTERGKKGKKKLKSDSEQENYC